MSKSVKHSPAALAAKRQALVSECALQRINAASDIREIMAPVHSLRHKIGGSFAIPMSVAGLIGGIVATRGGRLMPMLTTGLSLWKLGRDALAAWRQR
jgi:hypothetical protein